MLSAAAAAAAAAELVASICYIGVRACHEQRQDEKTVLDRKK
jgi:hypothetical protein